MVLNLAIQKIILSRNVALELDPVFVLSWSLEERRAVSYMIRIPNSACLNPLQYLYINIGFNQGFGATSNTCAITYM